MSLTRSLVTVSTRRPVTIFMFTVALLVFGMVLVDRLGLTLLPDLSYPTLTVRTDYQGAAPSEVESLITKPIEESLGVIKNLRQVRSISRAGQSDVILEFSWGTDMGMAGLDVREKLDLVQLPLDVPRPTLLRFNPSLDPIVRLSFSNTDAQADTSETSLIKLRRIADEEVKRRLESIDGIAAVKISGGLEDEVQVLVDQHRLAQLNLSIDDVANYLKAQNVNLSGGRLEQGTQQFLVRTLNQYQSIDEINNSIVKVNNGRPIYMKDIATVQQLYREREAITRIDGMEAVEIAIYKEGDANTVAVARRLQQRLDEVRESLSENYQLETIYDQSRFIEQAINEVISNAAIGGVLAMLILYFFLRNFRSTLIISLSIPISVIVSFNLMYGFDITMNMMSLGGIALAVGLLVDNAIVVLENIASKKEQGLDAVEAAQKGTVEVAGAITAATLTTIAVFLPLVFVEGIAGQLFSDQALTVTFALIVSLLVALTLIPMMSSYRARTNPYESGDHQAWEPKNWFSKSFHFLLVKIPGYLFSAAVFVAHGVSWLLHQLFRPFLWSFNKFYRGVAKSYDALLKLALSQRAITLLIAISFFAWTLTLIPKLGMELIPEMAQGELVVELKAQPGTPIYKMDRIVNSAQAAIASIDGIESTYSVAGTGNRLDASPDKGGENWGELNVVLQKPITEEQEQRIVNAMRDQLSRIPGVESKINRPTLFTFKTPLEIEIQGFNLDEVKSVSDQLTAMMRDEQQFSDIKSTLEQGHPEIQIAFDQQKAAHLGLSVPDVAQQVVNKVRGNIATKYAFNDRKIDVLVRVSENERSSVEDIRNLVINPQSAYPVPLRAVADVKVAVGPSEIHRLNQERVAVISANLRYGDLGEAAEKAQAMVNRVPERQGINIRVAGQNEEMEVSFRSLQFALALAVFLVYLVMASQFESLLHPFVILFSVPLALTGAILALYATNSTVSVVVFIGLIMLAGIVVNNAIVLIDRINQLRHEGLDKLAAIKEAGRARLRPIVMTTLTTTLGMLPLALGLGEGAEIRAPMAITVIGGLLLSTLLTLVVIPVLYSLMDYKSYGNASPSTETA